MALFGFIFVTIWPKLYGNIILEVGIPEIYFLKSEVTGYVITAYARELHSNILTANLKYTQTDTIETDYTNNAIYQRNNDYEKINTNHCHLV